MASSLRSTVFNLNRAARLTPQFSRSFSVSQRAWIKVGDAIPTGEYLMEGSPGNKVDLGKLVKEKGRAVMVFVEREVGECFKAGGRWLKLSKGPGSGGF